MSGWMHHVGALFGRRQAPSGMAAAAASAPPSRASSPELRFAAGGSRVTAAEVEAPSEAGDWRLPFFAWVTGIALAPTDALQPTEIRLLGQLDAILASDDSRASLLPRAPAIIPQLLNSLRQEGVSASVLAQRVMRDPHLVAEVIRLANSAQARAGEPVVDIAQAIDRIGIDGLRRAIARVVLKPMYAGAGDTLSARCAQRLWQHSEAEAAACQQAATALGLDPFEGYLAGLMHGIGWTAALRAIDRSKLDLPRGFSSAFISAFERRRETFFALLVVSWQLTDGLTALGHALLKVDLAHAGSGLGAALRDAAQRASLGLLGSHPAASLNTDARTPTTA